MAAAAEKDKDDLLNWGAAHGVDFIAPSFVRKGSDIAHVRALLGRAGEHIKIIAKIENQEGLTNFDEILAAADGIMVARGDLGMEIATSKVFLVRAPARPLLDASAGRAADAAPARRPCERHAGAEADGAAVQPGGEAGDHGDADAGEHDQEPAPDARRGDRRGQRRAGRHRSGTPRARRGVGSARLRPSPAAPLVRPAPCALRPAAAPADCVMLSGETAAGAYPVEAVRVVSRICREAEASLDYSYLFRTVMAAAQLPMSPLESLASSAVRTAHKVRAALIGVLTRGGSTARLVAKYRPNVPVICVAVPVLATDGLNWQCSGEAPARQALLTRGLIPVLAEGSARATDNDTTSDLLGAAIAHARTAGLCSAGDCVVALHRIGHASVIKISQVKA